MSPELPNFSLKQKWLYLYPTSYRGSFIIQGSPQFFAYQAKDLSSGNLGKVAKFLQESVESTITTSPTSRCYIAICDMIQPINNCQRDELHGLLRLVFGDVPVNLLPQEDEIAVHMTEKAKIAMTSSEKGTPVDTFIIRIGC